MASTIQFQATLEVLKRKQSDQRIMLDNLEAHHKNLKEAMEAEKADVDRLESDNFMTSFLKLLKLHEGKLTKESEEYLKAKLDYERQSFEIEEGKIQLMKLFKRIEELEKEISAYNETLSSKRAYYENLSLDSPEKAVYQNFAVKEAALKAECVELEEAIFACSRALDTLEAAKKLLESAEGWATWDAWAGGGLMTDLIKYEKLDAVQVEFKRLSADLSQLRRELSDVGDETSLDLVNIDGTTKMFDIWFDNIFTDFKVKAQIKAQLDALLMLEAKLKELKIKLVHRHEVAAGGLKACTEALEGLLME